MESLALIVAIMFLFVLCIGPISYAISVIPFFPKWIKIFIAVVSILTGLWWLTLPTSGVNMLGIIAIYLGYVSLPREN